MSDPDLLSAPLRYFAEVAKEGSFTAAARTLHISQPSLSVAVKKLEEALGATLFHRSRQGVSLTRAGEILLEHARQADRTLEAAKEELLALDTEPRGAFTLGAHASLAAYLLPGFMARFLERYSRVSLSLQNGNSRDLERAVVERRLDLGLIVNPARHDDCVVVDLFHDRVGFVVSAALHRRHRRLSPAALLAEVPLLHVPELAQTQYLLGALKRDGVTPPSQLTCSSMELVKSLVLDGVGVGVLPYRVASHGVTKKRLLQLDALPVFDDVITLVRRFDLPMTAGARALTDELRAHGSRMPPLEEVLSAG